LASWLIKHTGVEQATKDNKTIQALSTFNLVALWFGYGVYAQILMPWRHWMPKIESPGVLDT